MDKKVFLAVSLCAGIFMLWNQLYLKPYTERQQAYMQQQALQQQSAPAGTETAASGNAMGSTSADKKTSRPGKANATISGPQTITLGNADYSATISTKGGVVTNFNLADYRGTKADRISRLVGGPDQLQLNSPSPDWTYLAGVVYSVQKSDTKNLVLSYEDDKVSVRRTYTLEPAIFSLDSDTAVTFKKPGPSFLSVGLEAIKTLPKDQLENERRQIFLNRTGGQKNWTVGDLDERKEEPQGKWFGFASRYFLNAISNRNESIQPVFQAWPAENGDVDAGFFYPVANNTAQIPVRLYYGPKDIDLLKQAGGHLDSAVDFGWFTVFAYPMLTALKWFYKYLHNFGLAIILLTVLVKLLTYPLTLKSMKSMKQMQRIQPQLTRLREKHKDDKEKLNKEMLQLMKANGYNPMSGCLPMFIQMPIFVALYNVLYGAIDLYGQPFFGWIHDLSAKDPFYVTPALLVLMMFVQQKMTPSTAADPAQQRMMMMMPVVFGFMMLWLPSGLTLYMLVNSVVSVLQQVVINKTISVGASAPA
ncbi:MAG: membrane protein insertase YidC [Deltaproteobacteria bacterium]|nr:membrane protein insertase YidC [Deltaproteobacteria bacterium]